MNNKQSDLDSKVQSASSGEPSTDRRKFVASAVTLATTLGASMSGNNAAGAETSGAESASQEVQKAAMKLPSPHDQRKPLVAMLVHPGVTLLDLLGPQTVLAPSCDVHLVWKNTNTFGNR